MVLDECGKTEDRLASEEREGTLVNDGTLKEEVVVVAVGGATEGKSTEVGVVLGGA